MSEGGSLGDPRFGGAFDAPEPTNVGLVRPYIMTAGRTRLVHSELRWETLIEAIPGQHRFNGSEQLLIWQTCESPLSIAEVSAKIHLPVTVVAIIAGDLMDQRIIEVHQTDPVEIEMSALERMIERVRSL